MSWQISEDGSHFIVEGRILCHDHDNPVLEIAPPGGIANLGVYAGAPWAPTETWHAVRQPGDIIDRIDELVDEQMAGGEPRRGYDFNDPTYPKCPHCNRHWHGLPVTERIAEMYSIGQFDESYRVDEDDSQVLCEGSDFIGPARPEAEMGSTGWITRLHLGAGWQVLGTLADDGVILERPQPGYRYQGFGMRAGFRIDHIEIDGVTVATGESADAAESLASTLERVNERLSIENGPPYVIGRDFDLLANDPELRM